MTTLAEVMDALLVNQPTPPTFPELLARLWDIRYSGQLTLHFAGGRPLSVVLSQPIQVPLDSGKGTSA